MRSEADVRAERGASLIAAIFLIVIVGFFGAISVSLVGTQSSSALTETQSSQALYITEGGLEFAQRSFAQNLDFYRSAVDPIVIPATNLGNGSFVVNASLPATLLRTRIPTAASPNPIRVYTTARFPVTGFLQIEDDITGSAEFVQYTGIAADTFTGIIRDAPIGGVSGTASPHERASRVYPVTTLLTALANLGSPCVPTPSVAFTIAAHPKFLPAGTLTMDDAINPAEEIGYTGSTSAGGVMTLTGVVRCLNLTSSAHALGSPVTPILVDGANPDYEVNVMSTGTVGSVGLGSAVRVVRKTIQR